MDGWSLVERLLGVGGLDDTGRDVQLGAEVAAPTAGLVGFAHGSLAVAALGGGDVAEDFAGLAVDMDLVDVGAQGVLGGAVGLDDGLDQLGRVGREHLGAQAVQGVDHGVVDDRTHVGLAGGFVLDLDFLGAVVQHLGVAVGEDFQAVGVLVLEHVDGDDAGVGLGLGGGERNRGFGLIFALVFGHGVDPPYLAQLKGKR
jgi:hypothetical protein